MSLILLLIIVILFHHQVLRDKAHLGLDMANILGPLDGPGFHVSSRRQLKGYYFFIGISNENSQCWKFLIWYDGIPANFKILYFIVNSQNFNPLEYVTNDHWNSHNSNPGSISKCQLGRRIFEFHWETAIREFQSFLDKIPLTSCKETRSTGHVIWLTLP